VPERDLVQDTIYRRLRRRLTAAAHDVDDAIGRFRGRPVRVLVEAASPVSMAVVRPVFTRLRRDPRLEFWFTTCDESWHADTIFAPLGITARVIPALQARWMKFDAYVNTDFWNMTWLSRRTRRIHFFHGVAGKYGLDAPVRIAPVIAQFDRLMFPNEDRRDRYAAAGLVDGASPRAALVGYPKVDCLVDGSLNRPAIERAIGLNPNRATVLYAPTWSPYSSLHTSGKAILHALSGLDVNVVVKLHDRSYDNAARASGGVDWHKELEPFCRERGIHLATQPDASPYLFAADALVTDHSSVGFEFMLVDRPLVIVDCPELIEKARVNPQKVALMRSAADVVRDPSSAAEAVRHALNRPSTYTAQRRAIAAQLFFGAGAATSRAVQCFYTLLALEAPAAVRASAAIPEHSATLAPFEARTT